MSNGLPSNGTINGGGLSNGFPSPHLLPGLAFISNPSAGLASTLAHSQNLTSNAQLFLGNSSLGGNSVPPESHVLERNEAVDLYVVKCPEPIKNGTSDDKEKLLVLEAQTPPKYHKVLASYPRAMLKYQTNKQQPAESAYWREQALTSLKNMVLNDFMSFVGTGPLRAAPQQRQLPPYIYSNPTVAGNSNSTSGRRDSSYASQPQAQPDTVVTSSGISDGMEFASSGGGADADYGDFFPFGASFMGGDDVDDMIFIAEADEKSPEKLSEPVDTLLFDVRPEHFHMDPTQQASGISNDLQKSLETINALKDAQSSSSEPVQMVKKSMTEDAVRELVVVGDKQNPAEPASNEPLKVCHSEAIAVACAAESVQPIVKAVLSNHVSSSKAEGQTSSSNEVDGKLDVVVPKQARDHIAAQISNVSDTAEAHPKDNKNENVLASNNDASAGDELSPEAQDASIDATTVKTTPPIPSNNKSKLLPSSSLKRLNQSAGDKGIQMWKKRCLSKPEKSQPSFDEATDLIRHVNDTISDGCDVTDYITPDLDALKRDNVTPREIQSMLITLSNAAKVVLQQKSNQIKQLHVAGQDECTLGGDVGRPSILSERNTKSVMDAAVAAEMVSKAQVEWVQCDACKKWRTLPARTHPQYPTSLDEDKRWICTMNTWSPHHANCDVPEESMLSPTAIKIKVWLRRIRTGDRYETRNNLKQINDKKSGQSSSTLKSVPVDWLRCCSPVCGKWRACLRTMNGQEIKNIQYPWYCWMGSWDETKASCSAPQEGFSMQGYHIAVTETDDGIGGTPTAANGNGGATSNANCSLAASSARRGNGGGADANGTNYEASSNGDAVNDSADDDAPPTIGISSRGRIVRSKFNVRKHLVNSKKQNL